MARPSPSDLGHEHPQEPFVQGPQVLVRVGDPVVVGADGGGEDGVAHGDGDEVVGARPAPHRDELGGDVAPLGVAHCRLLLHRGHGEQELGPVEHPGALLGRVVQPADARGARTSGPPARETINDQ